MKGIIRNAVLEDCRRLSPMLRKQHETELFASRWQDSLTAIEYSFNRSTKAWTWEIDGEVACIFGVHAESITNTEAIAWLLGSPLIEKYPLGFIRYCKTMVPIILAIFPEIIAFCEKDFSVSKNWLSAIGFTSQEIVVVGNQHFYKMRKSING